MASKSIDYEKWALCNKLCNTFRKALRMPLRSPSDNPYPKGERKGSVIIELNGEVHCSAEWARIIGVSKKTIGYRISRGQGTEDILRGPGAKRKE